jgi:hypothetical protein
VWVLLGAASLLDGGLIAAAACVGFVLDGLTPRATRWSWLGAAVSAVLAAVGWIQRPLALLLPSVPYLLIGIGLLVAFAVVTARSRSFQCTCDDPQVTVVPERIQAAMSFLGLVAALSMLGGDSLMQSYAPVWGSITAVVLWRFKQWVWR